MDGRRNRGTGGVRKRTERESENVRMLFNYKMVDIQSGFLPVDELNIYTYKH
jgi:hypothetical protein